MSISNHKNIILIIIITLLAFFGYWFLFLSKKDNSTNPLSQSGLTNASAPSATTEYDREFVTSLLGLSSVDLDVSVFESKVFKSLNYPEVPFTVNYFRESGRDNPFLPIGVDPSTTQSAPQNQVNVVEDVPVVNTVLSTPVSTASSTVNVSTSSPRVTPPNTSTPPTPRPRSF